MRTMTSPLSARRIALLRRSGAQSLAIEVVAETGSTNADLLARLDGLALPTMLVAEMQTAGRGRAGRSWHSTPGAALTFSLAWKFDSPLQALAGLPLAVGVAIAETLARLGVDVRLKWPNDILRDGRKLAGILIETASVRNGSGSVWAVIGIGLNVSVPDNLAAKIDNPVADLSGSDIDRDQLLAALLDGLSEALTAFDRTGFAGFSDRWNRLHAHAGQQVAILDHGRIAHEGHAVGVDNSGRLLLDTAAGTVAITAGDVSLRSMEG
jgi:BirA family transcriptional regulator, biotin operon repressor / biotin---[acetyl-CoA-carboxylase] ligase